MPMRMVWIQQPTHAQHTHAWHTSSALAAALVSSASNSSTVSMAAYRHTAGWGTREHSSCGSHPDMALPSVQKDPPTKPLPRPWPCFSVPPVCIVVTCMQMMHLLVGGPI